MTENSSSQRPGSPPPVNPTANPSRFTKPPDAATGAAKPPPGPDGAATDATGLSGTPEYRFIANALRGLREELVHDATAYRPLPRARLDGPIVRRLPRRLRSRMAWAPRLVVVALGLLVLSVGGVGDPTPEGSEMGLLLGLLPTGAVLLTLVRPITAFWFSLAADAVVAVVAANWAYYPSLPWTDSCFMSHLIVLTVVALRTGPRVAAWMWGLTAGYGFLASLVLYGRASAGNTVPVLFTSALLLLAVSVRHIRRAAQQEVTAERHVSAAERSRRTLLEERTTIARELHDVVAHHMSVVAIQAEAAPYRVADPPPELAQAFATIRENAVAALGELRRLLGVVRAEDYQAPDAPQPTLGDLDALLANVREAGLDVTKTVTGAMRELPQGVELSAYRIVQEALSNVLRHAPGATAGVEVSYVLGGLGLRIVNGPSTEPAKPSPGAGHGVTGMRERVTMLGGEMMAQPAADGGYEVTAFLPVVTEHVPKPPAAATPPHQPGAPSDQPEPPLGHPDPYRKEDLT